MEIKNRNGVTVREYVEYKYLLPLFFCKKCDQESYYFGYDTCRDCLRVCRCCGADVPYESVFRRVLSWNKKIFDKPLLRHICGTCFYDWKKKKKFQTQKAIKEGWDLK